MTLSFPSPSPCEETHCGAFYPMCNKDYVSWLTRVKVAKYKDWKIWGSLWDYYYFEGGYAIQM